MSDPKHSDKKRDELRSEAAMAYESHTHIAGRENIDKCQQCGTDFRNQIHLRVGETRESRIANLFLVPENAAALPDSGARYDEATIKARDAAPAEGPTPSLSVPQWVTSWPEWFGIHDNVTVVPKVDYDMLERELAEAQQSIRNLQDEILRADSAARSAKALSEPVAWVARKDGEAVMHLSKAHGWNVEEVLTVPSATQERQEVIRCKHGSPRPDLCDLCLSGA